MENGAASPGRWHPWQFFCKTGATSLVNVTGNGLVAAVAVKAIRSPLITGSRRIILLLLVFPDYTKNRAKKIDKLGRFSPNQVVQGLPGANHSPFLAFDQHFRRPGAGVVIGRQDETVSPGGGDGQVVAGRDVRHGSFPRQ